MTIDIPLMLFRVATKHTRDLETMTLAEIAQVLGLEDWKQSEAVEKSNDWNVERFRIGFSVLNQIFERSTRCVSLDGDYLNISGQ